MPFTPDAAHEELAQAKMDYDAVVERERRATAAAERELAAPLAERTGPLPERLPTLKYLPPEDQPLYARDVDGSFRLAWLRATDEASLLTHANAIGKSIHVLSDGETPATRKALELKRQQQEAKVFELLGAAAREAKERELAAAEAKHREAIAALEAERERIRREMKPGDITRQIFR